MTAVDRGKWVLRYLAGGCRKRGKRRREETKGGGSHHERRWTMSPWPGETSSIWGTPLGREPGQQLEK